MLQLLHYLSYRPIQLRRNNILPAWREPRKHLTKVSVHNGFDGYVVTSPCQVITSDKADLFGTNVLLQCRHEPNVVLSEERYKDANGTVQPGINEHLIPADD